MRHINLLLFDERQFAFGIETLAAGLAEESDERHEELRTDDIHLIETLTLIVLRNRDDTAIIEVILRLEHGYEHSILAVLFLAVLVEFGKEVLILMLGGRLVVLVLHLEHNGDILHSIVGTIAEDEIALGALDDIVVLMKLRIGEQRTDTRELIIAMLLKRFAHHFRG